LLSSSQFEPKTAMLIIECSHCNAKYQYDEARFEGKPSKKIRCARCQKVFEIINPNAGSPAVQPAIVAAPAERPSSGHRSFDIDLDNTSSRKARAAAMSLRTAEQRMPQKDEPEEAEDQTSTGGTAKFEIPLEIPPGLRMSLAVIDGPDAGSVLRIENPRVVIGRAGADLTLNDDEASRAHAAIEIRGDQVILLDLGSTNGTHRNGERIEAPVALDNHSEFRIGNTTLMLIVTEAD
jgi:predicted Zn finger-like uncharacterized protein